MKITWRVATAFLGLACLLGAPATARAGAELPNAVEELITPKAPISEEDADAGPNAGFDLGDAGQETADAGATAPTPRDAGPGLAVSQSSSEGPVTEPIPPAPKRGAEETQQATAPTFRTKIVAERPDPAIFGSSATTVTRDQLEALPGGDTQPVTQLVAMQPGIVADSFGSNLHVRGADGAVQYVIDGIPMVSPAVGTVGQLLNTIPTRLVQNVQIFTGGFPVEYSYSLGGVVDIRTRRPTDTPTAELQLTYGSYDSVDVAANYSQKIGKLGVIASADFLTTDRGLDTPDAVSILNDNRIGGNGFAKAVYEFNSRNRLELLGTYEQDRFEIPIDATMLPLSDAPPGAIRGNDIYGNPPPQFVPYDANPIDFERTIFAAASYIHTGDINSQLSFYAREIYESFNCDPAGSLGPTADPGAFCSNFERDAFHYGVLGKITWQWLTGNSWKAGVQVDEAPSTLSTSLFTRDDSSPQGGPDPSLTLSGGDSIHTLTAGAYLEDRIEAGKFTLLPGVRFDVQNTTFGGADEPNLFLNGPSARLGASYAPSDVVIFHVFAGYLWEAPTAFDAPVIAPLVNPSLAGQQLPLDVKPATTWSGEVGVTLHPTRRITIGVDGWGRLMHNWLDHENIANSALWAAFNWDKGWAAGGDLFANGDIFRFWSGRFILSGFGNVSGQDTSQQGIDSLTYLIPQAVLAQSQIPSIQDHTQFWTANLGLILHDADKWNTVSMRLNYGSGFHTGIDTNELVPEHTTVDLSASHTFDVPTRPQVVFDVYNLFNDIYAYRLGTAYFGNSQYAPLQRFDVRLILHFG